MSVVSGGNLKPKLTRTEFEEKVYHLIASTFESYKDWYVIEERRKYNPAMSEYIYEQNRGNNPHVVEVYYNGEYVCDVRSNEPPLVAKDKITMALNELIKVKVEQQARKDWAEKDKDEKEIVKEGIKLKMPKTCDVQGCYNEPAYRDKRGNLCLKHYQEFAKKGKI